MNKSKEHQLDMDIWEGCFEWAKEAFKSGWVVKDEWTGDDEIASSIHSFICRKMKIGYFKKKP